MPPSTDREWGRLGKQDPYYGVLSEERFRGAAKDEVRLEAFFSSGEAHVDRVLTTVRRVYGNLDLNSALDFGCGVGRLIIPLAGRFRRVFGLDISEGMLNEARAQCTARNLTNVDLLNANSAWDEPGKTFDLVHSFIVFQHIRPLKGMAIFRRLLELITPGGVGAIHFIFGSRNGPLFETKRLFLKWIPGLHGAVNLSKGRGWSYPLMEMNQYNMVQILEALRKGGCGDIHLESADQGGYLGWMVYFRKNPVEETR